MISLQEWLPYPNVPVRIKTKDGSRIAAMDSIGYFWFLDCTHPLSNRYRSHSYILEWEYVDQKHMDDVLLIKNLYASLKWAESVLDKVKLTPWDKVKAFIIKLKK